MEFNLLQISIHIKFWEGKVKKISFWEFYGLENFSSDWEEINFHSWWFLFRSKSNQRWMKLRTTVQLSGAITSTVQKKATLKREDSFLKRFSTRQVPEAQVSLFFLLSFFFFGGDGESLKIRRRLSSIWSESLVHSLEVLKAFYSNVRLKSEFET